MSFVKLDTRILDSTLWLDRDQRDVFVTALLMAEPYELPEPAEQLEVDSLEPTGYVVPAGWYGLVAAAGPGIVRRALVAPEGGVEALCALGSPDPESRTSAFEGRRLVRVNGGYLILNYMRFRDRDETAAQRMRRYRERQKAGSHPTPVTRNSDDATRKSDVADADADADAEKKDQEHVPPAAPRARRKAKTPLPEGFGISDRVKAWAEREGHAPRLDQHLTSFLLKAGKHGYAYADWDAAFMEAVRENWAKLPAASAIPTAQSVLAKAKPRKVADPKRAAEAMQSAIDELRGKAPCP